MLAAKLRIHFDVAGFDGQLAPASHRIARVEAQIHQYLFDLRWVGKRYMKVRIRLNTHLDIVPDNSAEQAHFFWHQNVEIEFSRFQDLASGESQ
jgi:hypothetical protein